jgi:hypothetical protein
MIIGVIMTRTGTNFHGDGFLDISYAVDICSGATERTSRYSINHQVVDLRQSTGRESCGLLPLGQWCQLPDFMPWCHEFKQVDRDFMVWLGSW